MLLVYSGTGGRNQMQKVDTNKLTAEQVADVINARFDGDEDSGPMATPDNLRFWANAHAVAKLQRAITEEVFGPYWHQVALDALRALASPVEMQ
jgi:hypothetical protein